MSFCIRKIAHLCMLMTLMAGPLTAVRAMPATAQDPTTPVYRLPPMPAPAEQNAAAGSAPADTSSTSDAPDAPGTAPTSPLVNPAPAPAGSAAEPSAASNPSAADTPGLAIDFPPPVIGSAPVNPPVASAEDNPQTPLSPIDDQSISLTTMGQPNGLTLSGGQLQSGIVFTLPHDQVVTTARLYLALKVSPALAARDTSLRLMLNGQDLGSVRLNQTNGSDNVYELDVPATMVVSRNNLSFSVTDENALQCERDLTDKYWVTVLPSTHMQLSSQLLDIGRDLSHFPLPFYDPLSMNAPSMAFVFSPAVKPEAVVAASMLASHFGLLSSYRNMQFPVYIGELPTQNGILFGQPGEKIGDVTLPDNAGGTLSIIDNPMNPVYKLLLVVGRNDNEMRQAAWRLIASPLPAKQNLIQVQPQPLPQRQPYDAPRWIDTSKPVYLKDLTQDVNALTASGLYHDGIRIGFRAAPDLFMWDGDFIPVKIDYRFPTETWIDEDNSQLDITLNGTFLHNLTVNKPGLLESVWRKLGGDTRQETYTLQLAPYLIYGDNQMQFYFSLKPKPDANCSLLTSNTIKSRIDPDSTIDLSKTHHFSLLPNLSYFVGAAFPFSTLADYSQTVIVLPAKPQASEIATLLALAARSGNATGITLNRVSVLFGLQDNASEQALLAGKDILAVSSLKQRQLIQTILTGSRYEIRNGLLSVKAETWPDRLQSYMSGRFMRQGIDADRYLASTDAWRGFISFESRWTPKRVVVLATATDDDQLLKLNTDLQSAAINAAIRGDLSVINSENGVRSYAVSTPFPRGEMPWYMMILWFANQHIILLALSALIFALVIGSCIYMLLARHAARRLENSANK